MRLIAQNLPSDQAIQSIQLVGMPYAVGEVSPAEKNGYIVVTPGFRTTVIVRPQARAFIPKGIMIENDGQWLVHQIRVGVNHMIHPADDAIPASVLRGQTLALATIQPGMDFAIDAQYIGPSSEPQAFVCDVIGDAA